MLTTRYGNALQGRRIDFEREIQTENQRRVHALDERVIQSRL